MKESQLNDFVSAVEEQAYLSVSEETMSYQYEVYKENCELIASNTFGFDKEKIDQLYYYQGHSKRDWIKSKITRFNPSTGYIIILKNENGVVEAGLCYLD